MQVAVVGSGIVGASAARVLARRGHRVTVFEQSPLFHDRGSSHGASRIVRRAYQDPFYTRVMHEAYPLWAELERDVGEQLLHEVGLLYLGEADAPGMQSLCSGLREHEVAHQLLGRDEVQRVARHMRLGASELAVFTPDAGYVLAERALRATVADARAHGAIFVQARIDEVTQLLRSHDAVLVASGAWVTKHIPALGAVVTLQTFAHLTTGRLQGPVFIEDGPLGIYGFPAIDPDGPKIGVHASSTIVDPDVPERALSTAHLEEIRSFAERRFGYTRPELTQAKTCLYTRLPNDDFAFGKLSDGVFYASACSGHGFKTGPWAGRILADWASGRAPDASLARLRRDFC